jgi:PAH dioxygenase large subunit
VRALGGRFGLSGAELRHRSAECGNIDGMHRNTKREANMRNAKRGMTDATWVDVENGTVSREIFTSDEVFQDEVRKVFARSWIYLAHESEVPSPGDFVTRSIAGAPIVVVRDDDGSVKALLNSCRHRGAKVCRGDSGNARRFICPYHGWSYERSGSLITTTFDEHLPEDFKVQQWGLVPVTRTETFHGLIFGCWDPDGPSLLDYLGSFRWYLESFVGRTPLGMEVLAPPHRWKVKANWKAGALNFIGDSQHVLTTHAGPLTLDPVRLARAGLAAAGGASKQIITDEGHGCTLTYLPTGLPAEIRRTRSEDLVALHAGNLDDGQSTLLEDLRVAVGTVFPNLSFIETQAAPGCKAVVLRLWQPVSATETEIISWVLAEREASAEYKRDALRYGARNFGIAGVFEQDDLELWASASAASDNLISARFPFSFHTARTARECSSREHHWPGRAFDPVQSEIAQLRFMARWQHEMSIEPAMGV